LIAIWDTLWISFMILMTLETRWTTCWSSVVKTTTLFIISSARWFWSPCSSGGSSSSSSGSSSGSSGGSSGGGGGRGSSSGGGGRSCIFYNTTPYIIFDTPLTTSIFFQNWSKWITTANITKYFSPTFWFRCNWSSWFWFNNSSSWFWFNNCSNWFWYSSFNNTPIIFITPYSIIINICYSSIWICTTSIT